MYVNYTQILELSKWDESVILLLKLLPTKGVSGTQFVLPYYVDCKNVNVPTYFYRCYKLDVLKLNVSHIQHIQLATIHYIKDVHSTKTCVVTSNGTRNVL